MLLVLGGLLASAVGLLRAVADNRPLVSPELSQVVNLQSKSDGTDVNAQFRGVGEQGWAVHDKVKLLQGRRFKPGLRDVVGKGATHWKVLGGTFIGTIMGFRGLPVGGVLGGLIAWAIFWRAIDPGDYHMLPLREPAATSTPISPWTWPPRRRPRTWPRAAPWC
ncbi:hypothetical protein NB693_22920 [Pantoea ananatis]|uniref:hypothetical protein n=1 Tax=Pantoea ananas TaxID=553 RepID=UPI002220C912|nr:hypothetical protein [Pantoea ananatis]